MNYTVTRLYYETGKRAGQPTGSYRVDQGGSLMTLPSVTTILRAGLPSPQLVPWALRTGVQTAVQEVQERVLEGETITAEVLERVRARALAEPDRARDDAGNVGTQVHDAIEDWLRTGAEEVPVPEDPRAANGVRQFLDFWTSYGLQLRDLDDVERPVASIRHAYAGQIDAIALDADFQVVLLDWKTSKGIYDSHELQAVAYRYAVEEQLGILVDRIIIARFGRDDAEFEAREVPREHWSGHMEQFLRCRDTMQWQRGQAASWRKRS